MALFDPSISFRSYLPDFAPTLFLTKLNGRYEIID